MSTWSESISPELITAILCAMLVADEGDADFTHQMVFDDSSHSFSVTAPGADDGLEIEVGVAEDNDGIAKIYYILRRNGKEFDRIDSGEDDCEFERQLAKAIGWFWPHHVNLESNAESAA